MEREVEAPQRKEENLKRWLLLLLTLGVEEGRDPSLLELEPMLLMMKMKERERENGAKKCERSKAIIIEREEVILKMLMPIAYCLLD
jgi:hypothetical protein